MVPTGGENISIREGEPKHQQTLQLQFSLAPGGECLRATPDPPANLFEVIDDLSQTKVSDFEGIYKSLQEQAGAVDPCALARVFVGLSSLQKATAKAKDEHG